MKEQKYYKLGLVLSGIALLLGISVGYLSGFVLGIVSLVMNLRKRMECMTKVGTALSIAAIVLSAVNFYVLLQMSIDYGATGGYWLLDLIMKNR